MTEMIRLYVDDKRPAPEGWTLVKTLKEAHDFILEKYQWIEAIDFDYYLDDEGFHRGDELIDRLIMEEVHQGIDIFHMPIENYTFHSSDSSMNDRMRKMLEHRFGVKTEEEKPTVKVHRNYNKTKSSSLQRMLKKKKRM